MVLKQHSVISDWLFNTQSKILQAADWSILDINEKATLNINISFQAGSLLPVLGDPMNCRSGGRVLCCHNTSIADSTDRLQYVRVFYLFRCCCLTARGKINPNHRHIITSYYMPMIPTVKQGGQYFILQKTKIIFCNFFIYLTDVPFI